MNINPVQLIQMIKGGFNPQQLLMNVLNQQSNNNPILQNVMNLAQGNNTSALESIARNLSEQRGIDFDKEFNNFRNSLMK